MKRVRSVAVVAALFAGAVLPAGAGTRVSYTDPARFADGDRAGGLMTPRAAAEALASFLEALGGRLGPDRDLAIEILDVDLAGRIAPERDPSGTRRVLDRSTWPRIRLAYTVRERGGAGRRREELASWRDYLDRAVARFAGDPLRFEKAMLAEWFETRFPKY